jgi:hypothetical protein
MKMVQWDTLFPMFNRIGLLCVGLKSFFRPMGLVHLVVLICFLNYLELTNSSNMQLGI